MGMPQARRDLGASFTEATVVFGYQNLTVYKRALEYDALAAELIPMVRKRDKSLAHHLARSGNSFLTNLGEGASDDRPLVKASHYRIAKREAEECAICWEKSLRRGYTPRDKTERAIALLHECVLMLAALIRRFDPPHKVEKPPKT
jgi:four helix bundle protein